MMEGFLVVAKWVWSAFVFVLSGLLKVVWDKFKDLEKEVVELRTKHENINDKVIRLESTTVTRPELSASIDKVVSEFRGDLKELDKTFRDQITELRTDIKEVVKILSKN